MEAFKSKEDLKLNQTNYLCWLQGLYIQSAVASVFPKGSKYYEKPINFSKQPDEMDVALSQFEAYALTFNKKFDKGGN